MDAYKTGTFVQSAFYTDRMYGSILIWVGGLLFHSILSKTVVEITLRCTGCEEKKICIGQWSVRTDSKQKQDDKRL